MSALPGDFVVSAFATLFVVVDPIGLAPIFLSVTHGLPNPARRQVAMRACLIAATVLAGSALVGDWLLRTLGISLAAFRIAGGLLLFSIASEMVFGVRIQRETRTAEEAIRHYVRDIAAFPLAVPLMAGPGAITATVLLAGQAAGRPIPLAALIGVIVAVIAVCLGVFLVAARLGHIVGTTGNLVLSRLLGILLAALAVQFVVDGLRAVLAGG
jgi:multiple antibiotic resistance protein